MRTRTMLLGGGAVALMLAAAPAFAQPSYQNTPPSQTTDTPMQSEHMQSTAGAAEPLSRVSDPQAKLQSANVMTTDGQQAGQVQMVKTSSSGKATAVEVSLSSSSSGAGKVVSINARDLRYDPSDNSLKTRLTLTQIQQLPSIQSP